MTYAVAKIEEPSQEYRQLEAELPVLLDMLKTMRPSGSKAEKEFIRKYIVPLGAEYDHAGNCWVVIGKSRVMWSSHTDTVHSISGVQALAQLGGTITAVGSDCLGADCTTGVWVMRQMILAGVPGVYVFHRAEEVGGRGSAAIAQRGDDRLEGVQFAIAFDRKGKESVITHQMGQRCASQAFVDSIAPMLPGDYVADDGGTFTDTANYMGIIPECTNISVGYFAQHTPKESQDLRHAADLALCMMTFDESLLVAERDPTVVEYVDYGGRVTNLGPSPWNVQGWSWDDEYDVRATANDIATARGKGAWEREVEGYRDDPTIPRSVFDIVRDYPDELADFLEQQGYDVDGLMQDMGMKGRRH